jgi:hypothetical protein
VDADHDARCWLYHNEAGRLLPAAAARETARAASDAAAEAAR